VIFSKSIVIKVDVDESFTHIGVHFVNCKVDSILFKYFGLQLGVKRMHCDYVETSIYVSLRSRLGSWTNKYASLGGRIVVPYLILK